MAGSDLTWLEREFGPMHAEELEELEYYIEEHLDVPISDIQFKEAVHRWGSHGGPFAIDVSVSGVEPLAKSFETLSARAHKQLIPAVLAGSVNRLNTAIVKNIPVGPRGHEGDTGGWRNAQSRMSAGVIPTSGRHTTTAAAALPSDAALGIQAGESYYPFNVEYGSRIAAALAPIRRAVHALERSELGEILDLLGHGLGALALVMGPALLLRKAIFGRATPKEFMPIDYSRAQPGDTL